MLGTVLALAAGAVMAATPVTPLPWFEFEDYPMKAFERGKQGVTQFELLVAPDGKIAKCTVTRTSGSQDLDKTTCHLASKRVQFRPARAADGRLVFGIYRSEAVWALPENYIAPTAGPDLEVSVNQLPAGTTQPPVVKLAYQVDAQGNASSCTPLPTAARQPQVLVDLGCRELLSKADRAPVIGPQGQPVQAVKTAAVKFNAGS